jgi:hypothetical protein
MSTVDCAVRDSHRSDDGLDLGRKLKIVDCVVLDSVLNKYIYIAGGEHKEQFST